MLNITKSGNSLVVEGLQNKAYPDNGKLSIPMNSVIIVLDDSEFVTFRSSANNNVYFSANINQIRISGASVTKQTIIAAFDAVANASSGGGGGGDQVQANWLETNPASKAFIQNKPTNVSAFTNDAGYLTTVNEAFPSGWHTSGSMADLINDINNDNTAHAGDVYLDTVSFEDLPESMVQAELKAEIMSEQSGLGKVILFTVTSSNVSPYMWQYTSAYGSTGAWRSWALNADLIAEIQTRQQADSSLQGQIGSVAEDAVKASVSGTTLVLNNLK